jgi:hypothetical protein
MGPGFCPFAPVNDELLSAHFNFGSRQGLVETASADHDEKYLNIPAVNFATTKYTSKLVCRICWT